MAFTLNRQRTEDLQRVADPEVTGADLVTFVMSRDTGVKTILAGRADCPMACMYTLAQEGDSRILEALVANPSIPRGLLEQLAKNRRSSVKTLAAVRLDQLPL
jgi:hypothetical protein